MERLGSIEQRLWYADQTLINGWSRSALEDMGVAGYETKIMESLPQDLKGSLPTVEEFEAELAKDDAASDIK